MKKASRTAMIMDYLTYTIDINGILLWIKYTGNDDQLVLGMWNRKIKYSILHLLDYKGTIVGFFKSKDKT